MNPWRSIRSRRLPAVLALWVWAQAAPLSAQAEGSSPSWARSDSVATTQSSLSASAGVPTIEVEAPPLATNITKFGEARRDYQRALASISAGGSDKALQLLESASELDPQYPAPHFARSRLLFLQGKPIALDQAFEGLIDASSGFSNRSRLAANGLVVWNLTVALMALWTVGILLLRYAPFLAHQLRARFDPRRHLVGRGWVVWLLLLAPAVPMAAGLGIVPVFCLAFAVVWIYAGTRPRVVLGLLMAWMVAQGLAGDAIGTLLTGIVPHSRANLLSRAAHEPAEAPLVADLTRALNARPGDADLLFARGLAQARRGELAASVEDFQASLQVRPDDARTLVNLSNSHLLRGNADRAVAGYQKAAAVDPTLGAAQYNLGRAYMRKLFFKEAGEAMAAADASGFQPSNATYGVDVGELVYVRPDDATLWQTAWQNRGLLHPTDLLQPWSRWVGVPTSHVGWWLLATWLLAWAVGQFAGRSRLVFECGNCGALACARCSRSHEGSMLCHGCSATAKRAKSDLVLSTLLRNRKRAAEVTFQARVRHLNRWLFSAGELYHKASARGVFFGLFLSGLAAAFITQLVPFADPWSTPRSGFFGMVRWITLGFAGLLLFNAWFGQVRWRGRQLLLYPESLGIDRRGSKSGPELARRSS